MVTWARPPGQLNNSAGELFLLVLQFLPQVLALKVMGLCTSAPHYGVF